MYNTTCVDTLALDGESKSPKTNKQNILFTYHGCSVGCLLDGRLEIIQQHQKYMDCEAEPMMRAIEQYLVINKEKR